jgi:hypothetical protein
MAVKFQLRRDTAANWTANNPILSEGEPGVETDTLKFKLGDGTTAWTLLDYAGGESDFTELINKPTTLSGYGITDAASSAQGSLADSAVQPGDLAAIATSGSYNDLSGTPTTLAGYGIADAATSAQGSLADSAVQPSDNISTLTNDSGYITSAAIPTTVSSFTNDSGYLTSSVFGSAVSISDSTASTSTSTGALTVTGGVGVGGALYAASVGIGTGGSLVIASSNLDIRSNQAVYIKPNNQGNAILQVSTSGIVALTSVYAYSYVDRVAGVEIPGGGVFNFNCNTASTFRTSSGTFGGSYIANIINLPTVTSTDQTSATVVTMIIDQESSPNIFSELRIGGIAQTVRWLGGSPPSLTSNTTEVISLLISGTGTTDVYSILASSATYG